MVTFLTCANTSIACVLHHGHGTCQACVRMYRLARHSKSTYPLPLQLYQSEQVHTAYIPMPENCFKCTHTKILPSVPISVNTLQELPCSSAAQWACTVVYEQCLKGGSWLVCSLCRKSMYILPLQWLTEWLYASEHRFYLEWICISFSSQFASILHRIFVVGQTIQ